MNQEQLASFREACNVCSEGRYRCSVTYERRLDNDGKYFEQWQAFAFPLDSNSTVYFCAYSSTSVEDCLKLFVDAYETHKWNLRAEYERSKEAYNAAKR